jgi:hypothetical protein
MYFNNLLKTFKIVILIFNFSFIPYGFINVFRFYCKLYYSLVATYNLMYCIRLHLMMAHRSRNML